MDKKAKPWQVILVFGLLAALMAAYGLTWIPTSISATLPGVQFRKNAPHEAEARAIAIQGKLYTPLFRDPHFSGSIVPDGYPVIEGSNMLDVVLQQNELGFLQGNIHYKVAPATATLGMLYFAREDKEMKSFCIALWESAAPNDMTPVHTDLYFSAPAQTLEEALAIQARFRAGEDLAADTGANADE